MTTQQLPERPNLEQLKRQAKDLLHSAQAGDPAALTRFRGLPAFHDRSDSDLSRFPLGLHDAQSVLAREHGFACWNALRERVEEITLQFVDAVREFIEAATDGRTVRAARILAHHPGITRAGFHVAVVLGDAAAAESHLQRYSELATQRGGPRDWEPLLYLCHTAVVAAEPARADGVVAIARRLLALGADPNSRYPWLHHGVQRPVLWGAVCVTRVLALAEVLLVAGADPNDGVTLTIAAGGGDIPALELLHAHGADVNQAWATDGTPSLYSILAWATTAVGVRWLLEHGADPNRPAGEPGETAVHAAARKCDVPMMELLASHGADLARPRRDGRTPYALAALAGNRAVAEWLATHGAPAELSPVETFLAACSCGDRATAQALLAADPDLRDRSKPEQHPALRQAAERNDVDALEVMLACGFDVDATDEMGATALHCAAHAGWPEAVRLLLAHGASVVIRDNEFHGPPLVWAADGARTHGNVGGRNYDTTARLLLAAGSPVDWQPTEEPADALTEILAAWRRG